MTVATKAAKPTMAEMGIEVGDFFAMSWGYDQTNVDFFMVTEVKAKSIKVMAVQSQVVYDDGPSTKVVPTKHGKRSVFIRGTDGQMGEAGQVVTKIPTMGWRDTPTIKVGDSHWATKWDGQPKYETGSGYGH